MKLIGSAAELSETSGEPTVTAEELLRTAFKDSVTAVEQLGIADELP